MKQRRWTTAVSAVLLVLFLLALAGCAALKRDIKPGYPAVNGAPRSAAPGDAD